MLLDDREGVAVSDAPAAALVEHGTDEFAVPPADTAEPGERAGDEREWFGRHPAYPRNTPDHLHTPDLQTRLYVGLWLPGAGALLTYGVLRGNYWAAFVGIELLLVGWFTLAKL
jgi:hypothetical protein